MRIVYISTAPSLPSQRSLKGERRGEIEGQTEGNDDGTRRAEEDDGIVSDDEEEKVRPASLFLAHLLYLIMNSTPLEYRLLNRQLLPLTPHPYCKPR